MKKYKNVNSYLNQKVVKKEKGPAPPPPSLPNSVAPVTVPKELTDEKIAPESNVEEIDNKHEEEITESITSTTPDDTSTPPEVIDINLKKI